MRVSESLLTVLRSVPLFSRITSAADMAQLERLATTRTVSPGQEIVVAGEEVTAIDLICSGEVAVCFSGGTVESLRLGPGSLFGEMEFFQGKAGLATVMVVETTELLSVHYDDLRRIVRDNAMTGVQLYHGFLTTMVGKHKLVTDSLVDFKLDNSRQHLAHDLRGPLMALRILADRATSLPADQHELLGQVVERLEGIVRGLAMPSQGAQVPTAASFTTALSDLANEKRLQLDPSGHVKLETIIPGTLAMFDVGTCASEFLRIVANLLDNSIAAMHGRAGTITLCVWESGAVFGIDVHDEGRGIDSDVRDLIGKAPVTRGKADGQGMGLFHAHRIIQSWGGELVVQSAENCGTLVGIRLAAQPLRPTARATRLHSHVPSGDLLPHCNNLVENRSDSWFT